MNTPENTTQSAIDSCAYAHSKPTCHAIIRQQPADFKVTEIMPIEPCGEGEHVWVWVKKVSTNTDWLAQQIARFCGVKTSAVSYAGLKDRHAETIQWFSVHLPGQAMPDWKLWSDENSSIESAERHTQKLRRGALKGNAFCLTLRDIQGQRADLEQALVSLQNHAYVPNYFTAQRFGRQDNNISQAQRLFNGELTRLSKHKRGLYLSTARSLLFNAVLSARVQSNTWQTCIPGDVMILNGSNSFFQLDLPSNDILERLREGDIHPSAPLWGEGELATQGDALELEIEILEEYGLFRTGLEKARLKQARRSLRLPILDFGWDWLDEDVLQVRFKLTSGAYASAVLRELCQCVDAPQPAA